MIDPEYQKKISESIKFWNETEGLTKKGELLCGAMIVPAISELRYAGRKLVDFLDALLEGHSADAINEHISDYTQCCIRARHDAVDAMVGYMKAYYDTFAENFGIGVIHQCYPHQAVLIRAFEIVDARILLSREERHSRNELYSEINDKDIDGIIEKFKELKFSQPIMIGLKKRDDRQRKLSIWMAIIGFMALIVAIGTFSLNYIKNMGDFPRQPSAIVNIKPKLP